MCISNEWLDALIGILACIGGVWCVILDMQDKKD